MAKVAGLSTGGLGWRAGDSAQGDTEARAGGVANMYITQIYCLRIHWVLCTIGRDACTRFRRAGAARTTRTDAKSVLLQVRRARTRTVPAANAAARPPARGTVNSLSTRCIYARRVLSCGHAAAVIAVSHAHPSCLVCGRAVSYSVRAERQGEDRFLGQVECGTDRAHPTHRSVGL